MGKLNMKQTLSTAVIAGRSVVPPGSGMAGGWRSPFVFLARQHRNRRRHTWLALLFRQGAIKRYA
jgi:hypothetical protein